MIRALHDACAQVRQQGFAILEGLYPPEALARIGAALDDLYRELGAPPLHARDPLWLRPHVEVAGPGLAIYQLLRFAPQLAADLFAPEALAVLATLLGPTLHLELVGAVRSDEGRPFTEWETHLGGIDDERWRREHRRPRLARIERVVHFLFLEELDEATGPWCVLPRAVGDPVDPPASIHDPDWPGARMLGCPAGAVLLLEQSVWHCVRRRRRPGVRRFVGAYFAGHQAAPTLGRDDSLDALAEREDLPASFRALLGHRPPPR